MSEATFEPEVEDKRSGMKIGPSEAEKCIAACSSSGSSIDSDSDEMTRFEICLHGGSTVDGGSSDPSSLCNRQPCCDPEASFSTGSSTSAGGEKHKSAGKMGRRAHRRHRRRAARAKGADGRPLGFDDASSRAAGRRRLRALRRFKLRPGARGGGGGEWQIAMAPRNSNEFLIADHGIETPSFLRSPASEPAARADWSMSEEEYFESASEEGEFQERNFAQMYEQVHEESLSDLRHEDLVSRCIELEEEVASLKQQTDRLQGRMSSSSESDLVAWLKAENSSLRKENSQLLEERRKPNDSELRVERAETNIIV